MTKPIVEPTAPLVIPVYLRDPMLSRVVQNDFVMQIIPHDEMTSYVVPLSTDFVLHVERVVFTVRAWQSIGLDWLDEVEAHLSGNWYAKGQAVKRANKHQIANKKTIYDKRYIPAAKQDYFFITYPDRETVVLLTEEY